MELTARQQEIKDAFLAARGTWGEPWDTVLRIDPDFVAAYLGMYSVPWRKSHLSDRFKELCYISVNAAATHLHVPGILPHVKAALDLGATPAEIMEVLELAATLGIHTMNIGVPLLAEVLEERGHTGAAPLSAYQEHLKAEFTRVRGYWHEFWNDMLELDPEMFEAYLEFSGVPWRTGPLSPAEKELIYISYDPPVRAGYQAAHPERTRPRRDPRAGAGGHGDCQHDRHTRGDDRGADTCRRAEGAFGADLGIGDRIDSSCLLEQDRSRERHRLHSDAAGNLHHFEDLGDGRAVPKRVLDVQLEPDSIEVRSRGVKGQVDELAQLRAQGPVLPRVRRELGVGVKQLRVEFQHLVPRRVPVSAADRELILQPLLVVIQRNRPGTHAAFRQHLRQDGHAYVHGVDAERRGAFQDLHDLRYRRPGPQRRSDVLPYCRRVQMGHGRVDHQADQRAGPGVKVVLARRYPGEVQISLQESRIKLDHVLPGVVPRSACCDERILDLLLTRVHRHHPSGCHKMPPAAPATRAAGRHLGPRGRQESVWQRFSAVALISRTPIVPELLRVTSDRPDITHSPAGNPALPTLTVTPMWLAMNASMLPSDP
jgi:alkylhydroperoxidase/carboxymuconolactone decarboxylase family protein YurZ